MIRSTLGSEAPEGALRPSPRLSPSAVRNLARVFKLLSDETRLRIVLLLAQTNELHVRALCEALGQSQPAVSHHLGLLRMAGLIEPRRAGKHNFYHLLMAPFEQLLELWFAGTPPEERRLRLAEYVLCHAPAPLPATPTSTIVVATTAPA